MEGQVTCFRVVMQKGDGRMRAERTPVNRLGIVGGYGGAQQIEEIRWWSDQIQAENEK